MKDILFIIVCIVTICGPLIGLIILVYCLISGNLASVNLGYILGSCMIGFMGRVIGDILVESY